MDWEPLPHWFWTIYDLFLLITIGTAFRKIIQKIMVSLSILAITLVLLVPIVSLLNGMGRVYGMNEWEHILYEFQQGEIWAIFTLIGHLYLLIWWILVFNKEKMKAN